MYVLNKQEKSNGNIVYSLYERNRIRPPELLVHCRFLVVSQRLHVARIILHAGVWSENHPIKSWDHDMQGAFWTSLPIPVRDNTSLNSVIHIEELDNLLIEGAVAETAVATNRIKFPVTVKCKVGLPGFR